MPNKYKLARHDSRNWAIYEWLPAGELIRKGPHSGETRKEGRWNDTSPVGFYPHARAALRDLLNVQLRDGLANGEGWIEGDVSAILQAIEEAETRVMETAQAIDTAAPQQASSVANPAADFSREQLIAIRDSKTPAAMYLMAVKENGGSGKRFKRSADETARKLTPDAAAVERVSAMLDEDES